MNVNRVHVNMIVNVLIKLMDMSVNADQVTLVYIANLVSGHSLHVITSFFYLAIDLI